MNNNNNNVNDNSNNDNNINSNNNIHNNNNVIDNHNSSDNICTFRNTLMNKPPLFYSLSSSGMQSLQLVNQQQFMQHLTIAANIPLATCTITNLSIKTPFIANEWAAAILASHFDDHATAITLVKGMRVGMSIGFQGNRNVKQECKNLISADEFEQAVDEAMQKEIILGRRAGPYDSPPFLYYRCSPIGTVPKNKRSDKRRMIHHLSWPRNTYHQKYLHTSVNAGISEFDVTLDAFDQALKAVSACGTNSFMAKIDIEAAYRCIPVQPQDWPLLCMKWKDKYYFDTVLPFGLASATAIFEWFSSLAEHVTKALGHIQFLTHYIDDFLNIHRTYAGCKSELDFILKIFAKLGIPIAVDKLEGPTNRIIFLGIIIDTTSMTLCLDDIRLKDLHIMLNEFKDKKKASKRELQSCIGRLSFASKAVISGRTFLRRMIDHMKSLPNNMHADTQYDLSEQFFADLSWWRKFLSEWNGKSFILNNEWVHSSKLHIYTDACVIGYSGVFGEEWYSEQWTPELEKQAQREKRDSMPWKELYAVATAAATWGPRWSTKRIVFHCDCMSAVQAWNKSSSIDNDMCELIRTILYLSSTYSFDIHIMHIPGVDNVCADLLSRGQVKEFLSLSIPHSLSPIIPLPPPIHSW